MAPSLSCQQGPRPARQFSEDSSVVIFDAAIENLCSSATPEFPCPSVSCVTGVSPSPYRSPCRLIWFWNRETDEVIIPNNGCWVGGWRISAGRREAARPGRGEGSTLISEAA